jgi:hypothetical protein
VTGRVAIDTCTRTETGVYSVRLPNALVIPINEFFTDTNPARIPDDGTVVIACLVSGHPLQGLPFVTLVSMLIFSGTASWQ